MKTTEELQSDLQCFTGTSKYWRFSPIFPNVLLTDGAQYVAEEMGAYWLMDVIASHLPKVKGEQFAFARLQVENESAKFELTDDIPAKKTWANQKIPHTDFPLPEITLYVGDTGDGRWVIYLPREH